MVWSCHPKEVDKKTHEWPLVGFLFFVSMWTMISFCLMTL